MKEVLPAQFKEAMRRLAATVTLVTTAEEGMRHGMPATAVSSLSAEPPSLLACINRRASMHGPASRAAYFCVNILSVDQSALCEAFGKLAGSERFMVGEWLAGPRGLPYLTDAAAVMFCKADEIIDYATHSIFLGRIEGILLPADRQPLVYLGGTMGRFAKFGNGA